MVLLLVTWLAVARLEVSSIIFLYLVKVSETITLDSAEAGDVIEDMMSDIILYRFISSIFDINILIDETYNIKIKNKKTKTEE